MTTTHSITLDLGGMAIGGRPLTTTANEQERIINDAAAYDFKKWKSPRRPNAIWLMRRDVLNGGQSFQPLNQSKMPDLNGKECVALAYRAQGYGIKAIGVRIGVHHMTVRNFLVRNGLPLSISRNKRAIPVDAAVHVPLVDRTRRTVNELLHNTTRNRIAAFFGSNGLKKNVKSQSLIGCTWDEYRTHIFNLFEIGMTWDNFGAWQIDHIVPLNTFDVTCPKQLARAFNWRNTRPMWAVDNLRRPKDGSDLRRGGRSGVINLLETAHGRGSDT